MMALAGSDVMQDAIECWKKISPVIQEPQNRDDYETLSHLLDSLLDVVGDDESHELMGLIDILSHMISIYDDKHYPFLKGLSGVNALKYLMGQFALNQNDLKYEIGSQGVVSEILNGKRQLNVTQIKKLADRFKISPATFID